MQEALKQMLAKHKADTPEQRRSAIREILQEIILCGLSRGEFFSKAAFYGGTALRIFHGLDRWSEDLDFSLLSPDPSFDFAAYFPFIEGETAALGLHLSASEKTKKGEANIKSAYARSGLRELVLYFYPEESDYLYIEKNELMKIKLEVDVNPPQFASYESKFGLLPSPYGVRLFDLPSLFAGKIHACLCRNWQNRVKGRDLYDYLFLLAIGAKVNMDHLNAKLRRSKFIPESTSLTIDGLKAKLNEKFATLDFEKAKEDVYPFVNDKSKLSIWGQGPFIEVTKNLEAA